MNKMGWKTIAGAAAVAAGALAGAFGALDGDHAEVVVRAGEALGLVGLRHAVTKFSIRSEGWGWKTLAGAALIAVAAAAGVAGCPYADWIARAGEATGLIGLRHAIAKES